MDVCVLVCICVYKESVVTTKEAYQVDFVFLLNSWRSSELKSPLYFYYNIVNLSWLRYLLTEVNTHFLSVS